MILKVNNLSKRFEKSILKNITFELTEDNIISLVGASGSGKTTLLRCIAGLEDYEGDVYFNNKLINGLPTKNRNIGMVTQESSLLPHLSVYENIALPLKIRKQKNVGEQVNKLIQAFKIATLKNKLPQEISGGEAQRVAIARALIYKPRLLLLDEPFAQLDENLKKSLMHWLKDLITQENILTLFVTHNKEEARFMSDKQIHILDGGIKMI